MNSLIIGFMLALSGFPGLKIALESDLSAAAGRILGVQDQKTVQVAPSPTITPQPIAVTEEEQSSNSETDQTTGDQALMTAVNQYRQDNQLSRLQEDGSLCSSAQNRANHLSALGALDNHAGFDYGLQNNFSSFGEVLYGSTEQKTAEHIVSAWGNSSQHRSVLADPKWQYGCGARAGNFAAFIFGQK
ncbi:CAP domain-containing protein [Patescibacteria group bacterium]